MTDKPTKPDAAQPTTISRTIYLPCDMDSDIGQLAFHRNTTRNEVIADLIKRGLAAQSAPQPSKPQQAASPSRSKTLEP
jgi:hypothetical protein